MSSQILITGATGFIGRQLTRDLVARGENVRVLARSRVKARRLFGEQVEVVAGDLAEAASLERACRGVETVYHVAGTYRFGLRHRRELWETNVDGTENLFRTCAAAEVRRVVHLSSAGVLRHPAARTALLKEEDFPARPPAFSAYKASKWEAERRALAWAKRGLSVSIASTTCPLGRGDESPTPTGQIIRDFLQGRFPFYCRAGLNFIGLADLSRGLQQVAAAGLVGERYLLSGDNLWLKEFLDLLARKTGLPAPRWCLPQAFVRLAGLGGEALDFLNPRSASARVCLETALQAEHVQFFDNGKARRLLGWQPASPLRETVADAVAWFRQEAEPELAPAAASSLESHVR